MGALIKAIQSIIVALGIIVVVGTGVVLYYNVVNPPSNESEAVRADAANEESSQKPQASEEVDESKTESEEIESPVDDVLEVKGEAETANDTPAGVSPYLKEGHDHVYSRVITRLATCIDHGEYRYECAVCGDFYTEPIPLAAHKPGDWVTIRLADYNQTGLQQRYCTVCGRVLEEQVLPMLEKPQGTTTSDGNNTGTNTGNNNQQNQNNNQTSTQATNHRHTYTYEITTEATCTEKGERTYTCIDGDSVFKTDIPAKNHPSRGSTVVEGDCGNPGKITTKCNICGAIISEEELTYEHSWGPWRTAVEPTDEDEGQKKRMCRDCGEVETKIIPPLGYGWG